MTNTVFSMFQTRYILDFLSASRSSGTLFFFPNTEISSLKMLLLFHSALLFSISFSIHFHRCMIGPQSQQFISDKSRYFIRSSKWGAGSKQYKIQEFSCNLTVPRYSNIFKGIVSPDWKGLQMVSLDRFEV
jgi:hypothetical protein